MSPVDSGRKILKYRLTSQGLVPPNRGCRQSNNCSPGLNEDQGFFRKMVHFSHEAEGRVRKENMQCHSVSPTKTFK